MIDRMMMFTYRNPFKTFRAVMRLEAAGWRVTETGLDRIYFERDVENTPNDAPDRNDCAISS